MQSRFIEIHASGCGKLGKREWKDNYLFAHAQCPFSQLLITKQYICLIINLTLLYPASRRVPLCGIKN
ncbi:MAG: hypothetical protein PUP92_37555 [Rhizonema sp. PD38]|nr:hypothetical protein [Rhizonema sp. PD38]